MSDHTNQILTLPGLLWATFERFGDRPALGWKDATGWKSLTYREVEEKIKTLAKGLLAMGVRKGDRVAIYSENCPQWTFFDFALSTIGAVTVPIYSTSSANAVQFALLHSEARGLIAAGKEQKSVLTELRPYFAQIKWEIHFDLDKSRVDRVHTMKDVEKAAEKISDGEFEKRKTEIQAGDLCTLMYTSGTTGDPKGVMLSHKNIVSNVLACQPYFDVKEGDACLSFLPLSHAFERTAGQFLMFSKGVQIWYAEGILKVAQNLLEVKPSILISVPRIFEKFYGKVMDGMKAQPAWIQKILRKALEEKMKGRNGIYRVLGRILLFRKIREKLGGNLRILVAGGAALADEIAHFFEMIGLPILQGYGLSETSPVLCVNPPGKNRIGTVGPALPNVEIRIMDDGEIVARGPNIMLGYYKDEEATHEVLSEDGWFKTGDIGSFDEANYLRITDRKKDIMKTSGGKMITPQIIENELKLHPLIEQACTVGDKRKYISVLLVPDFMALEKRAKEEGITFSSKEELIQNEKVNSWFKNAIDNYNRKRASFEMIKRFTVLHHEWTIESGEITPTLKPKRNVIYEKYADAIESMYS